VTIEILSQEVWENINVTESLRANLRLQRRERLCHKQQSSGYSVNGNNGEYALAQGDYLARIPEKVSLTDAAPIL